MKSRKSVGDIPLIDQAIAFYKLEGEDFKLLLDQHMHFLYPVERYVWSAPTYLLLAEAMYDKEHGRYWMISYAASTLDNPIAKFFELAPYKLDFIAFSRYRDIDKLKFYKWNNLFKYAKTKNSSGTTASSSSSTTTTSSTANTNGSETNPSISC
jgi:hypothetical protein